MYTASPKVPLGIIYEIIYNDGQACTYIYIHIYSLFVFKRAFVFIADPKYYHVVQECTATDAKTHILCTHTSTAYIMNNILPFNYQIHSWNIYYT